MHESQLESHMRKRVESAGGLALKFTSPNRAGVPDRIVVLPGGRIAFVELKTTTGRLRPLQKKRIRQLLDRGALVYVVRTKSDIEEMLHAIQAASISTLCDPDDL